MCLAIPGKVVEMGPARDHWALVDVVGVRRRVDVSLVEDDGVALGDWVLIHVGFAMSKISEEGASEQLRLLEMLGESDAGREEAEGYGPPSPAESS